LFAEFFNIINLNWFNATNTTNASVVCAYVQYPPMQSQTLFLSISFHLNHYLYKVIWLFFLMYFVIRLEIWNV